MDELRHYLGFRTPHVLLRGGRVTRRDDTPHVMCAFREVSEAGKQRSQIALIDLPIAHLVDLRPGNVVYPNGTIAWSPDLKTFKRVVDIDDARMVMGTRGQLTERGLVPRHKLDASMLWDTQESHWHAVLPIKEGASVLLIPSMLLFFAYYAPNSRLATEYLCQDFLDLHESIRATSTRTHDDNCRMIMPRGSLVSDVVPIGRIVFDKSGHALDGARAIANFASLTFRTTEPFALRALFPFRGRTQLVYRALPASDATGRRVHLMVDLISCSHPLPWKELTAVMEQSQRSGPASKDAPAGGALLQDFAGDFVALDPSTPCPEMSRPLVAISRTATAFPCGGGEKISIVRRIVDNNSSKRGRPKFRKAIGTSTKTASRRGRAGVQQIDVAKASRPKAGPEGTVKAPRSPAAAFDYVAAALEESEALDGVSLNPVKLDGKAVRYKRWDLAEVPETTSPKWSHIRDGKMLRCILFYEVRLRKRVAYVLEILRRESETYSTLVISNSGAKPVDQKDLQNLFDAVVDEVGLPVGDRLPAAARAEIVRVRHPRSNDLPERMNRVRLVLLGALTATRKAAK